MKNITIVAVMTVTVLLAAVLRAESSQPQASGDTTQTGGKEAVTDIWLNTVWKDINTVTTTKSFEVEKVTTVAGVRGVEAEDEATKYLYYRGSRRVPDPTELRIAIQRLEAMVKEQPNPDRVAQLKYYIIQCYTQLGERDRVAQLSAELVQNYPATEWAQRYAKESVSPP